MEVAKGDNNMTQQKLYNSARHPAFFLIVKRHYREGKTYYLDAAGYPTPDRSEARKFPVRTNGVAAARMAARKVVMEENDKQDRVSYEERMSYATKEWCEDWHAILCNKTHDIDSVVEQEKNDAGHFAITYHVLEHRLNSEEAREQKLQYYRKKMEKKLRDMGKKTKAFLSEEQIDDYRERYGFARKKPKDFNHPFRPFGDFRNVAESGGAKYGKGVSHE